MSDYAQLQSVIVEPKGSTLAADASVSDTELLLDSAQDFDDEGGTLDLNGKRLQYTSITEGTNPEDPDTLNLADPLLIAAQEDDFVGVVSGGAIPEDWYAVVTMGDQGEEAHVPIDLYQRAQWVPGDYPDPVPVVVSDDLQRVEDAPGRTVSNAAKYRNTDVLTWPGSRAAVYVPLSKVPIRESIQPFWQPAANVVGGMGLAPGTWDLQGRYLVIDDPTIVAEFGADDFFWVDYAWQDEQESLADDRGLVGAIGDLSTFHVATGQLLENVLYVATSQSGDDVTAASTGRLTSFAMNVGAIGSAGDTGAYRVMTGTFSGSSFTVRDVSDELVFQTDSNAVQVLPIDLEVHAGDYLAIWGKGAAGAVDSPYIAYTDTVSGGGYRNTSVSTAPTAGSSYGVTAGPGLPIFHAF